MKHASSWLRANQASQSQPEMKYLVFWGHFQWCNCKITYVVTFFGHLSSVTFHLPPENWCKLSVQVGSSHPLISPLSCECSSTSILRSPHHSPAKNSLHISLSFSTPHLFRTLIPPSFPPVSLLTAGWLGGESADLLKKQLSCNYRLGKKQTVHQSLPPQT